MHRRTTSAHQTSPHPPRTHLPGAYLLGAVLLAVVAAACGSPARPEAVSVMVVAVAGPTCPVQRTPPDPGCEDRPVVGARILVRSSEGEPLVTITTGEEGTAFVSLPPGRYLFEPQPVEGLLGTPEPFEVELVPRSDGLATELVVRYDTGIR